MKQYLLLLLAGLSACAPVEQDGMQSGSCQDALAAGAADLALTKINEDREEGYILSLHRLANVNMMPHVSNLVTQVWLLLFLSCSS